MQIRRHRVTINLLLNSQITNRTMTNIRSRMRSLLTIQAFKMLLRHILRQCSNQLMTTCLVVDMYIRMNLIIRTLHRLNISNLRVLSLLTIQVTQRRFISNSRHLSNRHLITQETKQGVMRTRYMRTFNILSRNTTTRLTTRVIRGHHHHIMVTILMFTTNIRRQGTIFTKHTKMMILSTFRRHQNPQPLLLLMMLRHLTMGRIKLSTFRRNISSYTSTGYDSRSRSTRNMWGDLLRQWVFCNTLSHGIARGLAVYGVVCYTGGRYISTPLFFIRGGGPARPPWAELHKVLAHYSAPSRAGIFRAYRQTWPSEQGSGGGLQVLGPAPPVVPASSLGFAFDDFKTLSHSRSTAQG